MDYIVKDVSFTKDYMGGLLVEAELTPDMEEDNSKLDKRIYASILSYPGEDDRCMEMIDGSVTTNIVRFTDFSRIVMCKKIEELESKLEQMGEEEMDYCEEYDKLKMELEKYKDLVELPKQSCTNISQECCEKISMTVKGAYGLLRRINNLPGVG